MSYVTCLAPCLVSQCFSCCRLCTEAEGYRFGEIYEPGISIYNFQEAFSTNADRIALGFMTWHADGTLLRLDSRTTADFIEFKLVSFHSYIFIHSFILETYIAPRQETTLLFRGAPSPITNKEEGFRER